MTFEGERGSGGTTPLDPDEAEGLLQPHITTQEELNEAEAANVADALLWAHTTRAGRRDPLSEAYVFELHRRMFGQVWSWAGTPRLTQKNVGVAAWEIRPGVRDTIADARVWRDALRTNRPVFPLDEIAVRVHHRLVWVHPFPNGNGRHARMMANLVLRHAGAPPLTWGDTSGSLVSTGTLRDRYLAALRAADRGDYGPLITFAKS
ncbi:mobile mystery protein B [Longimicrobium sp.]|jgi:Fic-DOC domain mobile mystery protein B|uniref:mobile mystery protein B n=1 Tax=Longimicrobium sp. TaxID=2029185 RepID=UPI002F92F40B